MSYKWQILLFVTLRNNISTFLVYWEWHSGWCSHFELELFQTDLTSFLKKGQQFQLFSAVFPPFTPTFSDKTVHFVHKIFCIFLPGSLSCMQCIINTFLLWAIVRGVISIDPLMYKPASHMVQPAFVHIKFIFITYMLLIYNLYVTYILLL